MSNLAKWGDIGSWTTALAGSTDLDSKTTTTAITIGAAITNGTSKDMYMDVSLLLGSINPSGSPYFELHLIPLLHDGSTYADRSSQTALPNLYVTTGSSAKAVGMLGILIPPGSFKLQLVNQTGVTTAASGNAFQYRLYTPDLNG